MDLRRTQTLVERCTKYNHEMGDKAAQYIGKKLLRPIPQAAIDANDQLDISRPESWLLIKVIMLIRKPIRTYVNH